MVRTQIQLTEMQSEKLKSMAKKRHVSMATIIRESVDEKLARDILISERERRERAIKAVGAFHSGVSNLGSAHDKHLGKAFE